ncbi:hypothetical protein OB69_04130 [Roseivirga seohaensis subsp. aquiponti]|uniref:Uncharacterized protein n=1 Tax=Roseivirga seohaensis subsp. aquiponti TaxID=1566026 RepID=A0A0L8ANY3_9BACT|nr:hypothetical protein [Roseivirga seohaensis]KOF04173.1 hypothetical protein OB69_04130 [Roseivirga seohaensis subsp. aquiponti]
MIRAEPKSILAFLVNHFDLIAELFDTQIKDDIISRGSLQSILENYDSAIEPQLYEYKILSGKGEDYVIHDPYFKLLEFVLQQFKPLLPEQIQKYYHSIRNLFQKLKQDAYTTDKELTIARIEKLSEEITAFVNNVVYNTLSLLKESRALKANTLQLEYHEKVRKARYWIENYIQPLNTILDIDHAQSIYNELLNISQYANTRRLDYSHEGLRRQFERLYQQLNDAERQIQEESILLTKELLPLLDRIKTESEILSGMHLYLTNGDCYKKKYDPPPLFVTGRDQLYNPHILIKTREYFDLFKGEEEVVIVEESSSHTFWFFDRQAHKERLDTALPVIDFFNWCQTAFEQNPDDLSVENYFQVTGLLFEEGYRVDVLDAKAEILQFSNGTKLSMPQLKITKTN